MSNPPPPTLDPSRSQDDPIAVPGAVPAAPVVPALGERTARGAMWSLLQLIATKIVNVAGLIILSWLLGSADYGYVGLVYGVAAFANLIQQAGVRDVLIQRGYEFEKWATPAFWLSLSLGILSTVVMIAIAPLAGQFFGDERIVGLIMVMASQNIIQSLCVIPETRIWLDLRFKLVAGLFFVLAATMTALNVAFASPLFNLGALAFILPWPIVAAIKLVIVWTKSPVRIGPPSLRLWRHMVADNLMLFASAFFFVITWQCDYFILGRLYSKDVVGQYFWAFNLSAQAIQMVAINASGVLLPSLAKLGRDPARQLSAFVRAARVLMIIAAPACLLQATLADPLIRLFFKSEWHDAIPIVQVLSVGWLLASLSHSACCLIKAQGRFRIYLAYTGFAAALFVLLVYIGARLGAGVGAACGVGVFSVITGPLVVYLAIKTIGGHWRDVVSTFAAPVLCGVLAFGAAMLLAELTPAMPQRPRDVIRVIVSLAVGMAMYIPLIRMTAPEAWRELLEKMRPMLAPLIPRRRNSAAPDLRGSR